MNNIMNNIKREAKKFWNDEDGMGVVESSFRNSFKIAKMERLTWYLPKACHDLLVTH